MKAFYREGEAFSRMESWADAAGSFWEGLMLDPGNKEMHRRFKEAVAKGKAAHKQNNPDAKSGSDSEGDEQSSSSEEEEFAAPAQVRLGR